MEAVPKDGEASPPYKWPKLSTPSKRRSMFNESVDSGLDVSFSSPPTSKVFKKPSPLRTPRTAAATHVNTAASPFRCFRLSSFASPKVSGKALKLSSTENTIGVRFCEGKMSKAHGQLDIVGMATTNSAARCLELPLLDPCNGNDSGFLNDSPNKYLNMLNDSGMFTDDFSIFPALDSPLKSFDAAGVLLGSEENDPYISTATTSSSPQDISKKPANNEVQRLARKKLHFALDTDCRSSSTPDDVFCSPKKPVKPFSSEWMQLVTGCTQSQIDLTSAAHSFLQDH